MTPYTILLVATAAGLLVLTLGVLRSLPGLRARSRRPARLLAGILVVTAVWCVAYALQLSSPDATAAAFWNDVRLLGPTLVSPIVFLFAAEYTRREAWFRSRRVVALFSVAAVTNVLAWTNIVHGLVRRSIDVPPNGNLFTEVSLGPWASVYATYDYVLMAAAVYMLVEAFRGRGRSRVYRGQFGTVLIALLVPTAANVLYFLQVTQVDGTPVGFAVAGGTFAISLYRYRLLDIAPIARSTVFENVELGAIVVNADGVIVDANEHARQLVDRDELVGTSLSELLSAVPTAADQLGNLREGSDGVEIEIDGRPHWFDVTPVRDSTGRHVGRVLTFNGVTDQMRRQRELRERTEKLERQNERLDQFASIVSHDLRNPLAVAQGYVDLATEDPDPEILAEIEGSLDRMEEIIEDVLALARQSRDIVDPEPVDLAAVATEAWNHVDVGDTTLHNDADLTVTGDPVRLMQLFENLFRNALEHGPDGVTVRVGDFDCVSESDDPGIPESGSRSRDVSASDASRGPADGGSPGVVREANESAGDAPSSGFFVEDDGPGIPEEDRKRVFDRGFTTDTGGTGFGLAIVQRAVEAHGWSIRVTEGTAGGARFEVLID